jgi:hypothetical protein
MKSGRIIEEVYAPMVRKLLGRVLCWLMGHYDYYRDVWIALDWPKCKRCGH